MSNDIILENVLTDVRIEKPKTRDLSQFNISDELKDLNLSISKNGTDDYLKTLYKTMKEKDPKAKCPSCGGKPMKGNICKVCGSGEHTNDIEQMEEPTLEVMETLFIPEKYKKERFNSSKLREGHEELKGSKSFETYVKVLDGILGRINSGINEKASLYISAPSGFGKETFAYTAIQVAKSRGLTVFPYLDLMEVNRLITAYETGKMKDAIVEDIKFTDIDLYRSDVCILKVPHNNISMTNYKVLLQVIDRRSRRGLPTIVLSRYNFKYFTALDSAKETEGIVSYNNPSPKNLQVFETNGKT